MKREIIEVWTERPLGIGAEEEWIGDERRLTSVEDMQRVRKIKFGYNHIEVIFNDGRIKRYSA